MAEATTPYAAITVGSLPADNGITMTWGPGSVDTTFMTKGIKYDLYLILNGKHADQRTVADTLNDIHRALTQTKSYPMTNSYQITDISTISTPRYIEYAEDARQILYGSALRVSVYIPANITPNEQGG